MREIRSNEGVEFRLVPASRKIEGYALLFNTESQDLGGFTEVIAPTALNGVLEVSDVLALYNHEENNVLARSTNGKGTLSLNVDTKGLKYTFSAPITPLGEEVYNAIERGDLRNSSFAFTVSENGQTWTKNGESFIRTITQFDKIYDVSPVYRPAYLDTTVAARSLDSIKNEQMQMEERDEIKVEVKVEIEDEDDAMEDMVGDVCEPTEDTNADSELIDIVYDGNTYTIPKCLIQSYIDETNKQKLEQYIADLEVSVEQLKKQCS